MQNDLIHQQRGPHQIDSNCPVEETYLRGPIILPPKRLGLKRKVGIPACLPRYAWNKTEKQQEQEHTIQNPERIQPCIGTLGNNCGQFSQREHRFQC